MEISKFFKHTSAPILIITLLVGSYQLKIKTSKPRIFISKQDSSINLNYNFLRFLNLGHKRLLSSLFWTTTILESDIDHYKQKDLNSWMFLRFDTISKLDPNFLLTYSYGGPYLSIVKDDLEGASLLYQKGTTLFPNEYYLLKNAAFHEHFEVGNTELSRKYYAMLLKQNNKIDPITKSTIARILSSNGELNDAYNMLLEIKKDAEGKNLYMDKKINEHLYALKAEIDLNCLNNKKVSTCDTKDFNGDSYITEHGIFRARLSWLPYRISRKIKN